MMTHAEMDDLYELYALGALETEAAVEIDEHLATDCIYCQGHVRDAVHLTATLSGLIDPVAPPADVRRRLLASVQPAPAVPVTPWRWAFAVPALSAACLALLLFSAWSARELRGVRTELDSVVGERNQLRSALEILSRSQTRTVQFGKSDEVAHGRVFVNRNGGFVFVGSDLPQIAKDRTFELWLVPPTGAPRPVGLARAGSTGGLVHVSQAAVDPAQIAAVAVSVEPLGGSSAPTTKPFLIVPLG